MATKNYLLKCKNKQNIVNVDTLNGQDSNLNLNQGYQNSCDAFSEYSKSIAFKNRKALVSGKKTMLQFFSQTKVTEKALVNRTAAPTKLLDFASNNKSKSDFRSWKKTNSSVNFVKNEKEENGLKKGKNSSINNIISSTLSLHIEAYENTPETIESDSFVGTKEHFELNDLNKNAKQIFIDSSSVIPNPFEFPRQQENDKTKMPEISQFKASQHLINPNQDNQANSLQPLPQNPGGPGNLSMEQQNSSSHTSEVVRVDVPWDELSKLDSELHRAADRLEIKNSKQLCITVCGSKDRVSVRLATDGTHASIPSSKPTSPIKEDKKIETTQEEISDNKSQKDVGTAEIGTQTEPWNEKKQKERVLVSSFAFAPYLLKAGKQVKCVQVNFVSV